MTFDSTTTVREIAANFPASTRVFEKLKIDYCCGGGTPLIEACSKAGVAFDQLEQMLKGATAESADPAIDFHDATIPALVDHIVTKHHVFTKDEMARLEPLFAKVVSVHGENHPELREAQALFKRLCADLTPHMFKEEQVLFPYILELEKSVRHKMAAPFAPFGTVNNPIRMMMREHDTAGDLLRDLRAQSSNYTVPADGCISYQTLYLALEAFEQDLHQHIHLENNILFPRAAEMEAAGCQ